MCEFSMTIVIWSKKNIEKKEKVKKDIEKKERV